MALAPVVGLVLGLLAAGLGFLADRTGLAPEIVAVLVVASLALLTRGLHLDGLADTADGLGSGKPAPEALEIMKRSDIGPFGVVTVVLLLLLQVTSLAQLWSAGQGFSAVIAVVAGRCAVTVACRSGVRPARPAGLGALVAGSVAPTAAVAAVVFTAGVAALGAWLDEGSPGWAVLGVALGLGAALLLERHAVRRLGGITGDVFGALVELATTVTWVALAAALS
jgi:adenosylcobinamide-GDP ribazoletransferase